MIPQYVVGWAKEKATTILRMAAPTLVIYHNPRDFHKKVVAEEGSRSIACLIHVDSIDSEEKLDDLREGL